MKGLPMQINRNSSSQNFGMALKIKPEAMESLKNASMNKLELLNKIGEDLKATKVYHLEVGKDLEPRITSPYANKYVKSFEVENPTVRKSVSDSPEFLNYKTIWDGIASGNLKKGDTYSNCISYESKEAALDAYNRINSKETTLEKAAELTKELDKAEVRRANVAASKKEAFLAVENKANELFSKFGVDA